MSALDDLFGAFEDENQSNKSDEPPEPKKPRVEDEDADNVAPDDGDAPGGEPPSRSSYTTLMSANVTASRLNSKKSVVEPVVPKAADPVAPATREIATGTSHDKTVRSYSSYPKNLPVGHVLPKVDPPKEAAKTYPFPLDPFQQQAVNYIDKEESVLVAAHVSRDEGCGVLPLSQYTFSFYVIYLTDVSW